MEVFCLDLKDKTLKDKTLIDKTLTDGTQKVAGSKHGCIYLEEDEDLLKAKTVSKRKKAKKVQRESSY